MYTSYFIPEPSRPPLGTKTSHFILRPLSVNDVEKDYDAVMNSIDHLIGVFGPDVSWPTHDLTLEQNLIDLGWHQKEFQLRRSFAYKVMAPDEKCYLGCVYIFPSEKAEYDAKIMLWVRQNEADKLDQTLFSTIKEWLAKEWCFKKVAFPGREQSWGKWASLQNK